VLEWSLFFPLFLAVLAFIALFVAAQVVAGRGNEDLGEKLLDVGFLIALAGGAWTLILFVLVLFDEPDEVWDMVTIVLVIGVFFALLLGLLFALFEAIFSRGPRRRPAVPEETSSPEAR
jgi:membrane protease YdiL (CAAX protease family)